MQTNVENVIMEAILNKNDEEVSARNKLNTSKRPSASGVRETILKTIRWLIHSFVRVTETSECSITNFT
jgi:hypothetical protein